MNAAPELPAWAALLVAVLVVAGAVVTFVGTVGLLRFRSFYERVHAPTLGSTLGMALVLAASLLSVSVAQARPVVHELLVAVFVTLTTPVALILLARAALYRDRAAGKTTVPAENAGSAPHQQHVGSRP